MRSWSLQNNYSTSLFEINQLLNTHPCIRDLIIKELFEDPNSQAVIKSIKVSNKELVQHINKYFEYYKDLYGDKEYGIPSAFAWKWFCLNNPIKIQGHMRGINSVSDDKTAIVWNRENGDIIHTLKGHRNCVHSVAISHKDDYIVTCSDDNTFIIWDIETGNILHRIKGHELNITSIIISEDDSFIITSSNDKTVIVWDKETGTKIHKLEGHLNWVRSVAISHDNSFIVTGSWDTTAKIWDIKTGKLIRTLKGNTLPIKSVLISHDDLFIITCFIDNTAKIWSLDR